MNPFDFVNSISFAKKDLMTNTENDDLSEKGYVPFIVNKSLSYFADTLLYANEINALPLIDNKLQYHFLLNSVRPSKRFAKWAKKHDSEDMENVKAFYHFNNEKAQQALTLLSREQLDMIKEKLQKGGENGNSRKHG
jgi:hypothetical protein